MNSKYYFAPGTVQHCRRPRPWLQAARRAGPALALLVAVGLVAGCMVLADWLNAGLVP